MLYLEAQIEHDAPLFFFFAIWKRRRAVYKSDTGLATTRGGADRWRAGRRPRDPCPNRYISLIRRTSMCLSARGSIGRRFLVYFLRCVESSLGVLGATSSFPTSTHGSFLGPVVDFVIVGESALYRFSGKTPAPSSISPNGVDRSGRSIDGPRKLPDPSQSARGLLFLRHGAKIKIPPRNSTSNVYVLIDTEKSTDRHCPRTMKSAQKCITVKVIGGVKKVRAE